MSLRRLILLLLLLPSASFASDYDNDDSGIRHHASEPRGCFDFDNAHVPDCLKHFLQESEQELHAAVENVRKALQRDRALFEDAQAKWLGFMNDECALRSAGAQAYADPDRARQLLIWACTAEMNRARVQQIKSLPLDCAACLQ